jgi:hypothetical protein
MLGYALLLQIGRPQVEEPNLEQLFACGPPVAGGHVSLRRSPSRLQAWLRTIRLCKDLNIGHGLYSQEFALAKTPWRSIKF